MDVLWTLNPPVFAVGVLGAHVDVHGDRPGPDRLRRGRSECGTGGVAGGQGLVAATTSVKFTYAVVLLAPLLAGRRAFDERCWLPRRLGCGSSWSCICGRWTRLIRSGLAGAVSLATRGACS